MIKKEQRERIYSLDIMRGLVIILMALDHVRDFWSLEAFSPLDLTQTYPEYFFTRWITHFCAPVFVFLAGTSIFLSHHKIKDTKVLSQFLLIRGLWLILIEILVINSSWTLGFFWNEWGFTLQVIWAIGIAMIVMAGLVHFSDRFILIIGLLIIFGHNILNPILPEDFGSFGWVWQMLHERGWHSLNEQGDWGVYFAYPIIPWIGVMAVGYAFGYIMLFEEQQRTRWLLHLGVAAIVLFIVLRFTNWYGDTTDWQSQKNSLFTLMSFINTEKYPPSLLYLLMTLGPSFLLLITFEKRSNKIFEILRVFGRVPFFFYVLHFIFIHLTSLIYFKLVHNEWFDLVGTQSKNWPEFYEPSMLRLYLAWLGTVGCFYFICKWYDHYKSTHHHWWLKYL